jgi:predicted Rdx family selenoprotein
MLSLCAPLTVGAGEEPAWRVWLEARFLAPAACAPVPESQGTVFAGGFWDGSQLVPFERGQWGALGLKWGDFESAARQKAGGDLAGITVRFQRDKRRVIEFAELSSEQPLVASAVLAQELGSRFADTLGEVLLLAVPSRYRAFVFPQHGRDPSQYAGMVWEAYRETAYPVSVELFEWRNGRIKAVGAFEP